MYNAFYHPPLPPSRSFTRQDFFFYKLKDYKGQKYLFLGKPAHNYKPGIDTPLNTSYSQKFKKGQQFTENKKEQRMVKNLTA